VNLENENKIRLKDDGRKVWVVQQVR
jgi:hypothetical protein